MSQIPVNSSYIPPVGTTVYPYNNLAVAQNPQQGTVPYSAPIYQYPQASIYGMPAQPMSGVNINIYNPAGVGGPVSTSNAAATYAIPAQNVQGQPQMYNDIKQYQTSPVATAPIANTPINSNTESENSKKTKDIVQITDDYVKTLESYLRSKDEQIRSVGIKELIERFEEDSSRYEDPALTALLNIALQDTNSQNRLLAMSPIASGSAHGDENTVKLLQVLQKSKNMYGQEALMANDALLKAAQTKISVPDNSSNK